MLKWLWLSALFIILDQVSKYIASASLQLYQSVAVFPMFNLTLLHNEGAAFSFLSDAGGWQRWFFSVLAIGVSLFIIYWLKNLKPKEHIQAVSLALILSGAIGNVIDRLIHGYVVDFLDFYYQTTSSCLPFFSSSFQMTNPSCHWPAFNVADIAISAGVILLIIDSVRESIRQKKMNSAQV